MVTHHVEEILPATTHCLLLKEGSVYAAGPKEKVLTSTNLSTIYGAKIRLTQRGGRYALRLT